MEAAEAIAAALQEATDEDSGLHAVVIDLNSALDEERDRACQLFGGYVYAKLREYGFAVTEEGQS